jgi:hypothetical protein
MDEIHIDPLTIGVLKSRGPRPHSRGESTEAYQEIDKYLGFHDGFHEFEYAVHADHDKYIDIVENWKDIMFFWDPYGGPEDAPEYAGNVITAHFQQDVVCERIENGTKVSRIYFIYKLYVLPVLEKSTRDDIERKTLENMEKLRQKCTREDGKRSPYRLIAAVAAVLNKDTFSKDLLHGSWLCGVISLKDISIPRSRYLLIFEQCIETLVDKELHESK